MVRAVLPLLPCLLPCPLRPPPRAPAVVLRGQPSPEEVRKNELLSLTVRKALLDEEERKYTVWTENVRPLKINLDLLAHRARVLQRRGDARGAAATLERCTKLDPNDG